MIFLVFAFVAICVAALIFGIKSVLPLIVSGNKLMKVLGVITLLGVTATMVCMFVEYARS